MQSSSKSSRKGQWFLLTAIVVIASVLNVVLITNRIYQTNLASDWSDDAFLFFISAANSAEKMGQMGYNAQLKQFYYEMYARVAEARGMSLNMSDSGGKTRISMRGPRLRIEKTV